MKTKTNEINIKVENMVSAITVDRDINLKEISDKIEEFKYNPDNFPGVIFRTAEPKVALLIFSSGRVICTGAKSEEEIKMAVDKLVDKFKTAGIVLKSYPKICVQNIVASMKLDHKVNLDRFAMSCEDTEYEPERFPGLVYRIYDPKAVILIFRSGKMIITGTHSTELAKIAAKKTIESIEKYDTFIKDK